ncbi:MAG: hypothetical protein J7J15_03785 [Candidatus Aenigmarchaeota archaeon]|nr:hypothetical protein [Candidatus Aenigmarchaeota archaeon]
MVLNIFNDKSDEKKGEYIIGVSSGMFGMASAEEKISLIDISQKGFYSALKGVNFTQIDLERGVEFVSPELEERVRRIREDLGIDIGIHGLCGAMGARGIFLDSAIEDDYLRTHEALIRDLERSGRIKAKYYLQHASETTPYGWLGKDLQPTAIVDIWGRRFHIFLKENPYLVDWAITQDEICEVVVGSRREDYEARLLPEAMEISEREMMEKVRKPLQDFTEEERGEVRKRAKEIIKENLKRRIITFSQSSSLSYGPERIAYYITAKWMSDQNDPIWQEIVGKKFEEVKDNSKLWVPAVSAKYIWGHFNPDKCKDENVLKICPDPKPILEKYNLDFVIETAMVAAGMEEEYRLTNPKHFVILCKYAGTRHFKAAIDFEHILGAGIDPEKDCINKMIPDGGKYINVLHVGWPTPIQPAHIPIPLGSEQQEWLYKWMLALRKKGFDESENRYIIFERASPIPYPMGGGADPVQQSTLALKKIIEFLRKDIPVEKLPPEFYGIENKDLKMQETEIREHAFDPIKGLLSVPEEKHGFLGKVAVEKGKAREWETEKYR